MIHSRRHLTSAYERPRFNLCDETKQTKWFYSDKFGFVNFHLKENFQLREFSKKSFSSCNFNEIVVSLLDL